MKVLFENSSSEEILGINTEKNINSIKDKLPYMLEKDCSFKMPYYSHYSYLLADEKPGSFYYSKEKGVLVISVSHGEGYAHIKRNKIRTNILENRIILVHFRKDAFHNTKHHNIFTLYFSTEDFRDVCEDEDIKGRKKSSVFCRNLIKKLSLKDYSEIKNELEKIGILE